MRMFLILLSLTLKLIARFKELGQHHYFLRKAQKSFIIGQVYPVFKGHDEKKDLKKKKKKKITFSFQMHSQYVWILRYHPTPLSPSRSPLHPVGALVHHGGLSSPSNPTQALPPNSGLPWVFSAETLRRFRAKMFRWGREKQRGQTKKTTNLL